MPGKLFVIMVLQAKQKAERNRQKVEEGYLKATHQQRVEAAQQRREDKRRAEKERMMNEEDPDKQRKWEVSLSGLGTKLEIRFQQ